MILLTAVYTESEVSVMSLSIFKEHFGYRKLFGYFETILKQKLKVTGQQVKQTVKQQIQRWQMDLLIVY